MQPAFKQFFFTILANQYNAARVAREKTKPTYAVIERVLAFSLAPTTVARCSGLHLARVSEHWQLTNLVGRVDDVQNTM